jgi:hypothetical protein
MTQFHVYGRYDSETHQLDEQLVQLILVFVADPGFLS